ncbi:MAG: acyl-CoA thioesterase [Rhodobacteraceae bacterium]|nr:MAG: acyl-CoA thioesterase [Paracoccaceae bacterium]
MPYAYPQKVIFKYCDPAGIVFYPRYFEMVNDATEALFSDAFGCPWEVLHETGNIPTVEITARFTAPSRHGDHLVIGIEVTKLGRTSLGLAFHARSGDETRFRAQSTLVHVGKDGRPAPWPEPLRAAITQFMEE